MHATIKLLLLVTLYLASVTSAHAYIGPGMGGGVIVAVLGIVGAIFLGLFGIIYFPIKRALKNKKAKKSSEDGDDESKDESEKD